MSAIFRIAGPAQPATMIGGSDVYRRDRFACHLAAVEALGDAGIEPPAKWTALRRRFASYVDLGDHAADRTAQELIQPAGGDLVALRAHALAEQAATTGHDAEINERVRGSVLAALESIYASVAEHNYRAAADGYNRAAKAFVNATKAVNVEADGNSLIAAGVAARDAWLSAPELAGRLEEAVRVLFAAAALAGAPDDVGYLTGATDASTTEVQIGLACDPGRAHRRRVWIAWSSSTSGRTGRWGALASLGVQLRAVKDPRDATPYRRPEQPIPVVGPNSAITHWDPHDGPIPARHRRVAVGWVGEHQNTDYIP